MNLKDIIRRLHVKYLKMGGGRCKKIIEPLAGRVAIVAPHPDDEVIGCGGLIVRLVAEGRAPHIIIMTGGEGSHRGCCDVSPAEIIEARRGLTRKALQILGVPFENIHELDYPDGSITAKNPQTEELKRLLAEINPQSVFVPHWGEGWPDHLAARKIGLDLASKTTAVYEYCVWMWYYNVWRLDWKNARRLKMSADEHTTKLRAIDAYIRSVAPCGHPWSGVLPQAFVHANSHDTELYFRLK